MTTLAFTHDMHGHLYLFKVYILKYSGHIYVISHAMLQFEHA